MEGTFRSLKEGTKLSITFNSKRITRSTQPDQSNQNWLDLLVCLMGTLLIYCLMLINLQLNSESGCQNVVLLVHRKMYKKRVVNEDFHIHATIGYTGMYFESYGLRDMYVIVYL